MKKLFTLLSLCLVTLYAGAQSGGNDPTFNPAPGANAVVLATALQDDGKVVIGGYFANYAGSGASGLIRLNTDGTRDVSFVPGTGAAGVHAVVVQPDDKILVAGNFTAFSGSSVSRIIRLEADGSIDASFTPGTGADALIQTMVIQPDGKIIIGGLFQNYDGTGRNRIARLEADGSLDLSFDPGTGADDLIYKLFLQSDGKILVGGDFQNYNGTARSHIARLETDGSLDLSFDPGTGFDDYVYTLELQPDGKILAAGYFTAYNGNPAPRIVRLETDGTFDAGFDTGLGVDTVVHSLLVRPDGKIFIAGAFRFVNGIGRYRVALLNADGSLDRSFNPAQGASNPVYSSALQPDGRILIGGNFTFYDGQIRNRVARISDEKCGYLFAYNPQFICNGASYTIGTSVYTAAGQYSDTLLTGFGCDSVVLTEISLYPSHTVNNPQVICEGASYDFNGNSYTLAGNYTDTLVSSIGCDSLVITQLTVVPASVNNPRTICEGDSYSPNGGASLYTIAGSYKDTLFNYNGTGCDLEIVTILTVNPVDTVSNYLTICQGQSYTFNGNAYTQEGVYYDVLQNVYNCDSVVITHLTVTPPDSTDNIQTICSGQSYTFNGNVYTVQGDYYDTVQTALGCDSVIITRLTVTPPDSTDNNQTICSGQSYTFNGNVYTVQGDYYDTVQTALGCDSVIITRLTVTPPDSTDNNQTICSGQSYTFNGNVYTVQGDYYDTLQTALGCDSVIITRLTVTPPDSTDNNQTICSGQSYTFNGNVYTVQGDYYDTLQTALGCDSVIITRLTVTPPDSTDNNQTICSGQSYTFNGNVYTVQGDYYDTLQTALGCDSVIITRLTVIAPDVTVDASASPELTVASGPGITYQWIDCDDNDAPIPGETAASFTATENGNYAVIVTVGTCSDTSACVAVINVSVGERELQNLIRVFPNPVQEQLNLQTDETVLTLTILNTMGQQVLTQGQKPGSIDVSSLAPGTYFLNVETAKGIWYGKFIKQ